jgi:hypothetical protein
VNTCSVKLVILNALPFGVKIEIVRMDSVRTVNNTMSSSTSSVNMNVCGMIHYMPSIESLDPRLREVYKGTRMPNSPKYGLGYIEQCDVTIPPCRFSNPLPKSITRPAIEEIMKYLTVMTGCQKGEFPEAWIKKMTNWDLFTNPEAIDFSNHTPEQEKERLSKAWKEYMNQHNCWISFYEWKKLSLSLTVLATGQSSETPGHKWKSTEGPL